MCCSRLEGEIKEKFETQSIVSKSQSKRHFRVGIPEKDNLTDCGN